MSYLGYPNTTGLTAIDYRLTDAVADPPGEPNHYVEELIRLPRAFCYLPPAAARRVAITGRPVQARSPLDHSTIWRNSTIDCSIFGVPCCRPFRRRTCVSFGTLFRGVPETIFTSNSDRGILPERFDLTSVQGSLRHLHDYAQVDIALDAFPWNGHTTACEAVWMGVPVITLYGDRYAGRMAASTLTALDLAELIAHSPKEFVSLAADWSGDIGRLVRWRAGRREREFAVPRFATANRSHATWRGRIGSFGMLGAFARRLHADGPEDLAGPGLRPSRPAD